MTPNVLGQILIIDPCSHNNLLRVTSHGRHVNHVVSGHLPVQVSCSRCQQFDLLNHSQLQCTLRLPLMAVEMKCPLHSLWPSCTTNLECPPFRLSTQHADQEEKKYASLSKASLLSYISFSKDIPQIAQPPNSTSLTTEQLQSIVVFFLIHRNVCSGKTN